MQKDEDVFYQFLKPTESNAWVVPRRIEHLPGEGHGLDALMLTDSAVAPSHHLLPGEFFNHEIVDMCSDDIDQVGELVLRYGVLQVPLPTIREASNVLRKLGRLNSEDSWQDAKSVDQSEKITVKRMERGGLGFNGLDGVERKRELLGYDYGRLDEIAAETNPLDLLVDDADRLAEDLRYAHVETYTAARYMLDFYPERITGTIISLTEIRTVAREIVNAANLIKWIGMGLSHNEMVKRFKEYPLLPILGKTLTPDDPVRRAFHFLELCSTPAFLYRVKGDKDTEITKLGEAPRELPAGSREGSLLEAVSVQLQAAATNGLPWHKCVWCGTTFQFKRGSSKEKTDRKRTEGNIYCCEKCRNSATQKAFRDKRRAEKELTESREAQ